MRFIKTKLIFILTLAIIALIPMNVNATSAQSGGMGAQLDAQGVIDAYYTAKGLTETGQDDAQNEVAKASKRFITTITIVGFGGVIIVLCLIYRRQHGVRI